MRLFLCYTPLHALIAKRIIESERFGNCVAVYICFKKTDKHEYYFNELAKKCSHSYFLTLKHSTLSDVFRMTKFALKLRLKLGASWTLFTGNIKHFHSRFLMFLLRVKDFNTFDDGSGNVSGAGYFYDLNDRKDVSVIFSLVAPRLLYRNLVESIVRHYTIYDFPNVFKPTQKITLLDDFKQPELVIRQERVVYLANAFSEDGLMGRDCELEMDAEVLKRWPVTDILMHPRSSKASHFDVEGVSIIQSNLIAEDYILSLISQGYTVSVVGVFSSTLLNLANVEGLNVINYYSKIDKPVEGIITLMAKLGINLYD